MIIKKLELPHVCERQLAFFQGTNRGPTVHDSGNGWYEYEYVPGKQVDNAGDLLSYLRRWVWKLEPLSPHDESDDRYMYCDYLRHLKKLDIPVEDKILDVLQDHIDKTKPVLVHGDATLENFVSSQIGIVPIDPGMPRGFSTVENDKGKILQSLITHWSAVSVEDHRLVIADAMLAEANLVTICSLISHWYRILKNAERHRRYVEWYGYNMALPILTRFALEEIKCTTNPLRHRWGVDRLLHLHHQLLPQSL